MPDHEHQWGYYPVLTTNPTRSERKCLLCERREFRVGPTIAMLEDQRMYIVHPGTDWEALP